MDPKLLLVERLGNVIKISLNRPDKKNAINTPMAKELYQALKEVKSDPTVRVVVLTGSGKAFSAGGDIKEMAEADDKYYFLANDLAGSIQRCVREMRNLPMPVIAAVNGNAVGAGMALVLGSDIVIASEDAKFSMGFVKIGLAPGCGTYFLARLVGYQKACEMVFYSDTFGAIEGKELGLVAKVAKAEELDETTMKWALRLEKRPREALKVSKELLNHAYLAGLEHHFDKEKDAIGSTGSTKEFEELITGFLSKKK